MRYIFVKLLICSSFLLLALEKEGIRHEMMEQVINVCNTGDLSWLEEITVKAEEDRRSRTHQGNFMGTVYLEAYQNDPVIFVRMAMGSGGLYGYAYRCDGSRVDFGNDPDPVEAFFSKMKKNQIIYTNVPAEINGE